MQRPVFILTAVASWGTSLPTLAANTDPQQISSFADVIRAGGWPMYVIIALSAVGLFLVIFYLLTFRAGVLFPRAFMREAAETADRGDAEALKIVCRMHRSPAASIMNAAAEQMTATSRMDYMAVRDAIEDEGSRQAGMLWQRLQYLMDVAVIAPMVGLLGTVLGMLQSFASMKTELGAVRPATLSQGVAQALITTAAGLIVGIAAMILYAIFRGRVSQLIARMEEACSLLLRKLAENYRASE
jgi:biopolymer transport protein ExbB